MFKLTSPRRATVTEQNLDAPDVIEMEPGAAIVIRSPDGRIFMVSCEKDIEENKSMGLHTSSMAAFEIDRCDRIQRHVFCYSDGHMEQKSRRFKRRAA